MSTVERLDSSDNLVVEVATAREFTYWAETLRSQRLCPEDAEALRGDMWEMVLKDHDDPQLLMPGVREAIFRTADQRVETRERMSG